MTNQNSLRTIPLFIHLQKSDRLELERQAVETPYQKGEFIFREGEPAEWFHIVKEGMVKCVKSAPDGREVTLKVLMPGDLFCCEASAFQGSPHPGCAQVMEEAKIVKVHRKVYLDVLRRNPEAAMEVISYLGERLRESQENAKAFALDRAEQRLASLLLNLAAKAGKHEAGGIRIGIRLTRRELADMAGLTVETTSRIMSRFKKAQFLTGTARRLVVRDLPGLKTLASQNGLASHSIPSLKNLFQP